MAKKNEELEEYRSKRDFEKSPEPVGSILKKKEEPIFVIQKHHARRLHFDFRIQVGEVLRSWAVPKGPSTNPKDRRLSIMTEDHPLDYADFSGTIPEGSYGAGRVSIWDKGSYKNITEKNGGLVPIEDAIEAGHFMIWLDGRKLKGGFAFTRINDRKNEWLLVKMIDDEAQESANEVLRTNDGALTIDGKDIKVSNPDKEIFEGIKKSELVNYYARIAPIMLSHVEGRPVSMYRFPEGHDSKGFYQKNVPDHFPDWIETIDIKSSEGQKRYMVFSDKASIVYLANLVCVPHVWIARKDDLKHPDKMIFDLDPAERTDATALKDAAQKIRRFLEELGLSPFIMTSGGKGYHIAVPLERDADYGEVSDFASKIADVIANSDEERLTTEFRIERRRGRIFIDTKRNSPHQTAVAPYAVRANAKGSVACPINWEDLEKVEPDGITLRSIFEYLEKNGDAWKDFFSHKASLKRISEEIKGI